MEVVDFGIKKYQTLVINTHVVNQLTNQFRIFLLQKLTDWLNLVINTANIVNEI